jgi:hypothetical protein
MFQLVDVVTLAWAAGPDASSPTYPDVPTSQWGQGASGCSLAESGAGSVVAPYIIIGLD